MYRQSPVKTPDIKTNNFVNESYLFTQGKTTAMTCTITAREPSMYAYLINRLVSLGLL